METVTLPNELHIDSSFPIQVFDYSSIKEISKQHIALKKNTISFLIEGTKEVFFDNSTLSIENSRFLIMKSGNCLMTEKLSEIKNYRSILFFFSNEILQRFVKNTELNQSESFQYKSVYAFKYDEFIRRFTTSLLDILKLSKQTQKKLLLVKFEEIMIYLTDRYGTDFLHALIENSDDYTQKFTQTIESNKLNRLTLKELAFLCNMSVSGFKRQFKKYYNESPIKWFQNKRLEHAYYLVHQKQKTSSEIYLEIGYENLSSFIKAYKTKFGTTPKQHQKN